MQEKDVETEHRHVKQQYLKEQIKYNGWDPQEFSEFLGNRREDGTDINSWEFDELILEVQSYKKFLQENSKKSMEANPQHANFEANKIQDRIAQGMQSTVFESKIERPNDRLRIIIMKSDKNGKEYSLKVLPENKLINRTLENFYWLRSKLLIEFPFYYVS